VLVLSLFMGGMGGGALLAGRLQASRYQPIVLYALIEALLGVAGIAFHPIYEATTSYAYGTLLPGPDIGHRCA